MDKILEKSLNIRSKSFQMSVTINVNNQSIPLAHVTVHVECERDSMSLIGILPVKRHFFINDII